VNFSHIPKFEILGCDSLASSRGGRWDGQTGGEMLPARAHRKVVKCKNGLLSGLVLFRLVAHPLQPGVLGLYSVRDVWFPSHLLLEGTSHI
jgi:hypothetical protein